MFKSCHTAFCWSIWHQASSAECQRLVLSKLDDSPTPTMTMMPQCWQWQWQQQKHFSVQQQQQQETPYKVSGWATTIHLLKALTITNNNNYTYIHTQKQTTNNKHKQRKRQKQLSTICFRQRHTDTSYEPLGALANWADHCGHLSFTSQDHHDSHDSHDSHDNSKILWISLFITLVILTRVAAATLATCHFVSFLIFFALFRRWLPFFKFLLFTAKPFSMRSTALTHAHIDTFICMSVCLSWFSSAAKALFLRSTRLKSGLTKFDEHYCVCYLFLLLL